jgi:integrator complex subunit 3
MEQKTFSSKPQSFSNNQPSQTHHHYHHHHYHSSQNESKFYVNSSIELKDQLENNLEESYTKLQNLINPTQSQQPENIQFNELSQYANQSKAHYDEISNALLYSILTDPSNSARCLRNLFLCNNLTFNHNSNDPSQNTQTSSSSYVLLITNLLNIITENYFRLLDTPRQQLLWLLKELVKTRVNQFDKLLLQMLRNIQSGLLSDKNIWLAESILEILYDQTTTSCSNNTNLDQPTLWLYSYNELMTQSVYTYLRLISDHSQSSALSCLKQRETEFCCQVLREKWNECMLIGRDLVRLLQNLAKINEFNTLWKDIITSPQNLSPQFAQLGGLIYLLRLPTRKRCLISRLTVDMERKIYFIITSVKAGQQKRYLEWFQRQYLNTAESQSLRIDLIRYICVVVHPTNEQLNAGLTPRWSLCAWLLNTCTSLIDTANLKLALFFDWIIYDAKKDNIMLIEPGILLMYYSIRQNNLILNNLNNINLTTMLFDFLCRIATNFFWPIKDFILNGIMQSFKDSVEKRVIPSLQIFFNSVSQPIDSSSGSNNKEKHQGQPILDRDIRNLIQSTFGNFFQTLTIPTLSNSSNRYF